MRAVVAEQRRTLAMDAVMLAIDCLLAAVLLTSSPDAPLPNESLPWAECCRSSLVTLALDAQILDARETLAGDAAGELRMLQHRFRELAFAPLVQESLRFPDRKTVLEFLAYNRGYRQELQARLEFDPDHGGNLRIALAEADQLYHIWCIVADTRWGALYVTARRQALQRLLERAGAEAFYSGALPPYVPVWRIPAAR